MSTSAVQQFNTLDNLRLEVFTPGLSTSATRYNLAQNNDGALGVWWWTPSAGQYLQPWTLPTTFTPGIALYRVTTSGVLSARSGYVPVNPGEYVQWAYDYLARSSSAISLQPTVTFYDAAYGSKSSSFWSAQTSLANGITSGAGVLVPSGAAFATLTLQISTTGTPVAGDYAVFGNVNILRTATSTALAYSNTAPAYTNVMPNATALNIKRATLDSSTLTATLSGSAMDPVNNPLLTNGAPIRATAWDTANSTWEPIFTGTITDAKANYYFLDDNPSKTYTATTLTAADAMLQMANTPTTIGVDGFEAFPLLLTGQPFPWNIDSWTGNAPPSDTSIQINTSTVADQLIQTRDTNSVANGAPCYAWVDRRNRLRATTWSPMASPWVFGTIGGSYDTNATTTITDLGLGDGSTVVQLKATAAGDMSTYQYFYDVTPGEQYTLSAWSYAASTPRTVAITVDWLPANPATVTLGTASVSRTDTTANSFSVVSTAPVAATMARVTLKVTGAAANEIHTFNSIGLKPTLTRFGDDAASTPSQFRESYSDISASYSTASRINQVTVTDGTTSYGPYVDQASVDKYGPASATFTIVPVGYLTLTNMAAFAAAILKTNSVPQRVAESITYPVLTDWQRYHAIHLDLAHLISLYRTSLLPEAPHRITGIEHNITTATDGDPTGNTWTVTYSFDPATVAQAPTVAAGATPGTTIAGSTHAYASFSYTGSLPAAEQAVPWVVDAQTVNDGTATMLSYSGGTFTFKRAGIFQVTYSLDWNTAPAAATIYMGRVYINANGLQRYECGWERYLNTAVAGNIVGNGSATIYANVGDQMRPLIYTNYGSAVTWTGLRFRVVQLA